jgi:hypothetical protein
MKKTDLTQSRKGAKDFFNVEYGTEWLEPVDLTIAEAYRNSLRLRGFA